MTLRAGGVHHVAIKSSDPERLAAFYRDVLGLAEVARHHEPPALASSSGVRVVRSVWLAAAGTLLMIERAGMDAAAPPPSADAGSRHERDGASGSCDLPGLHLVAFAIEPGQAGDWRARLEAAGHPVVHATAFTLYVQDPDGNRVGLSAYDSSSVLASAPPTRSDS